MKIVVLGFMVACMAMTANANSQAKDCALVEIKDGATKLSNKCTETINLTWFYEGACAAGCSKQIGSKIRGIWVDAFKEPYSLGVCYAPEKVDPQWKGVGPANCDSSSGKYLANTNNAVAKTTGADTPIVGVPVEIGGTSGIVKNAKTDPTGQFQFQELPAGEYALKVDGKPFKSVTVGTNGIYIGKLTKSSDGKIALTNIRRLTWK